MNLGHSFFPIYCTVPTALLTFPNISHAKEHLSCAKEHRSFAKEHLSLQE